MALYGILWRFMQMNERIRAHDLWTQVCQEDMPELDETFMTMRRTRKFAELIVRECSNFLKDTLDDHFAAEQLEEHFGVEE
jgi:hypothetical protein